MSLIMRFGQRSPQYGGPLDSRIRTAIRHCIADEVERLVDILDALSPDANDEPVLGWNEGVAGSNPAIDDREEDAGDSAEVCDDREPALGWTVGGAFGDITIWDEDEQ